MTTFQDPPPQSRRAVRQSERGESANAQGNSFVNPQSPQSDREPAPQIYSDPAAPQNMWDTVARRAAGLPQPQQRDDQPSQPGRRSSGAPVEPLGEPLTYSTQGRPQVPSYDGPSFRNRSLDNDALPATQALPRADQPSYRVRDFSPEGRSGAASAPAPSWVPPQSQQAPASAPSSDLDYQTQANSAAAGEPVVAPQPAPAADPRSISLPTAAPVNPATPASSPVIPEHTLTRRELRALQARADAEARAIPELQVPDAGVPEVVDTILNSGPIELPLLAPQTPPSDALSNAMAEFDALTRGSQVAEAAAASRLPTAAQPVVPQPTLEPEPEWQFGSAAESQASEPAAQPESVQPSPFELLFSQQPEPPAPSDNISPAAPDVEPVAEFAAPVVDAVAPVTETSPPAEVQPGVQPQDSDRPAWSPPAGHWSTQGDFEDETQPFESTINRTINSGTTTTNALVLPNIPMPSDMTNALTSTGEIMLTGSIDLPRSLGSTGASSGIDDDGIDSLFDLDDHELVSTDSQPVRAIRAISTHTTGSLGVTHTQKPKGNRMLTALIVSACGMAAVAVGLLITAMASGALP